MARGAKAAEAPKTRRRLTSDQKKEIAQALARGETGQAIAARMGVSAATVYAQGRKGRSASSDSGQGSDSPLRKALVSFAVRTLLGQEVSADERAGLERQVREEMVRRLAAGI